MTSPCLSVVIPVFNEEKTLARVVERVAAIPHLLEIVIVDDASTDSTPQTIEALASRFPQVVFTRHSRNAGKTAALRTGFALTRGDIVIVQDADLEYDPSEIADVIEPILKGRADAVFGSRFLVRKAARVLYFSHYVANKFLSLWSDLFTNLNMTDVETGYKAFRGEIIRNMTITSTRFGFEIEVTAKIAKLGRPVYEVPISYYGRTYEEGKKIQFKDAVYAFWYVFKYNRLVSLKKSFAQVPQISGGPARQPVTVEASAKDFPAPVGSR
ncbi:MAG TPA: glycosyltransferase family 2 protein [Terracidiphilus sp.]|nr:glycosyltransferase family 2 protein [Terracidiphilus sp.]